jgi:hypothetical protein
MNKRVQEKEKAAAAAAAASASGISRTPESPRRTPVVDPSIGGGGGSGSPRHTACSSPSRSSPRHAHQSPVGGSTHHRPPPPPSSPSRRPLHDYTAAAADLQDQVAAGASGYGEGQQLVKPGSPRDSSSRVLGSSCLSPRRRRQQQLEDDGTTTSSTTNSDRPAGSQSHAGDRSRDCL